MGTGGSLAHQEGSAWVNRKQGLGDDFYDIWLPNLSPSAPLMGQGQAASGDQAWAAFKRKFHAEMKHPEASHLLDLLAALSHQTTFSLGCYCEDENHCHRSVLRELLAQRGAAIE